MSRTATIVVAVMLAGASTVRAQDAANPMSANFKASWTNIRDLLSKMAEKMPEENYRFKATPELEDFGQRMAHVLAFTMRGCATVKGEQKTVNVSEREMPTKAQILAAMKDTNAYCDAVFNSLTDADLMKMIPAGRGGQRPAFTVLQGTVLEHSQEMYGYLASGYLRMKGIVPPSSDRNEQ